MSWRLLCLFYLSGGQWAGGPGQEKLKKRKCLITTDGKSPVKRRESQDMGSQSVRKMRRRGGLGESVQLLILVGLVGRTLAQQPTSEHGEEIKSLTFSLRMHLAKIIVLIFFNSILKNISGFPITITLVNIIAEDKTSRRPMLA